MPVSRTSAAWLVSNPGTTLTAKPLANPFSYQRIGGGLELNFKAWIPVKLTGGYTLLESKNGQNSWYLDSAANPVPCERSR